MGIPTIDEMKEKAVTNRAAQDVNNRANKVEAAKGNTERIKGLPDKIKKATGNMKNIVDNIKPSSALNQVSNIKDLISLWGDIKEGYMAVDDMLKITQGADAANLGKDLGIAKDIILDALVDYVIDTYYVNSSGSAFLEPNIIKLWIKMGRNAATGNVGGALLAAGSAVFNESVALLNDLEELAKAESKVGSMLNKSLIQDDIRRLQKKVDPYDNKKVTEILHRLRRLWVFEGKTHSEITKLNKGLRFIVNKRKEYIENFKKILSESQDTELIKIAYNQFKNNMEDLLISKDKQKYENLFKDKIARLETIKSEKIAAAKKEKTPEETAIDNTDALERAMLDNAMIYNFTNEFILTRNPVMGENKKTNRPLHDYDPGSMNGSANVRFNWK